MLDATTLFDREDRCYLDGLIEIPISFATFGRPAEIGVEWHHTENQGPIGSCQGNDLTSILERLQFVLSGSVATVKQLSRIFAYLATQKIDGLLGADNGSTISGGAKLATGTGAPPEELTGYPKAYPGKADRAKILDPANYAAAAPFKAKTAWKCPTDPDAAMNFIAAGGGISIGIGWYSGLIPADRVVRKYNPPARPGGHAMAVLGYTRNGNLRAVNSHADGPYEIEGAAWIKIMEHQRTSAIGLTGSSNDQPIDWSKRSPWFGD